MSDMQGGNSHGPLEEEGTSSNHGVRDEETPLVLVVDDEPLALDLNTQTLKRQGFRTETARGGVEALAWLENNRPDIVLLDISMPDLDGFAVFEKIRVDPDLVNLPVIFVTARDNVEYRVKGLELGAVDYITKPFNPSELTARVRATLRLIGLERELHEQQREALRLETVSTILTTVSHYINNAIAAIQGRAALVNIEKPDSIRKMTDVVNRQSKIIVATIQSIEDMLSRLELRTTKYISSDQMILDIEENLRKRIEEMEAGEEEKRRMENGE